MLQQKLTVYLFKLVLCIFCAVETVVKYLPNFKCAVNQLCLEGHFNFSLIQSAFNDFAKNELKCLNAPKLKNLGTVVNIQI